MKKKEKQLKKQDILDMLGVKEYWLDKEEQKVIEDYRKQKPFGNDEVENESNG